MLFHLPGEDIQLHDLPVSEVDCPYSAKWSAELSKFGFDGMDVFGHKFDDIDAFACVVSYKVFPCQFKCGRNIDIISVFVVCFSFFTIVFFSSFVSKEDSEVVQHQICIYFLL